MVNSEKRGRRGRGDYFLRCREVKFKCDKLVLRIWDKNYVIRKKNYF